MQFWTTAIRFNAPATIAGFIFFYLIQEIVSKENLPFESAGFSLGLILVVANFCAFLLVVSTRRKANEGTSGQRVEIKDNEISGNEVKGSIDVGAGQGNAKISSNVVKNNKIGGGLTIGRGGK
ncbi:MAG: hypothetical protein EKK46_11035 [Rhodocyclaceae bacterium]|nr:MAG: hypothetical protein EKK46_11035 [Rhodocyclaceae bacterium]